MTSTRWIGIELLPATRGRHSDGYEKAIDQLTINPANRLRRKVEYLTIEKSKVDLALSQIEDMKKRIGLV